MQSDDPRGHDDGDIIVADPERTAALREEIRKIIMDFRANHLATRGMLLQLAEEMGYSPDEIADMLEAEARILRPSRPLSGGAR